MYFTYDCNAVPGRGWHKTTTLNYLTLLFDYHPFSFVLNYTHTTKFKSAAITRSYSASVFESARLQAENHPKRRLKIWRRTIFLVSTIEVRQDQFGWQTLLHRKGLTRLANLDIILLKNFW